MSSGIRSLLFEKAFASRRVPSHSSFWPAAQGIRNVEAYKVDVVPGTNLYHCDLNLQAGAILLNIGLAALTVWNGSGAVTADAGNEDDPNGYLAGINLKATDLTANQLIDFNHLGGKQGADLIANAGTDAGHIVDAYFAAAHRIRVTITDANSDSTAGSTIVFFEYMLPTQFHAPTLVLP